jgi:hypothetical protein
VHYDNINHRVAKGEGCIGKMIGGSRKSIVEPNLKWKEYFAYNIVCCYIQYH